MLRIDSYFQVIGIYILIIIGCIWIRTLIDPTMLYFDGVGNSRNDDLHEDMRKILSNLSFPLNKESISAMEYYREKAAKLQNTSVCVYNRVPKCGSRNVMYVFRTLSKRNNYTYVSSKEYSRFAFDGVEQKSQVEEILQLKTPSLFDRHMYFINFTRFTGAVNPFYINVIREPIQQYVSFYYWLRQDAESRFKVFTESERNMVSVSSFFICTLKKSMHRV